MPVLGVHGGSLSQLSQPRTGEAKYSFPSSNKVCGLNSRCHLYKIASHGEIEEATGSTSMLLPSQAREWGYEWSGSDLLDLSAGLREWGEEKMETGTWFTCRTSAFMGSF